MDYKTSDKSLGIFNSKARTAILLNFFVNTEKEFYTRELEKKLGISAGNVRRELKKIENTGLIVSRQLGNLVLYKINKANPLYRQLKDLVIRNIGIQTLVKPYFEGEKDILFSFIYGSYARGEFDPSSDIDIFIVSRQNSSFYEVINKHLSRFEKMFGREFNADLLTKKEYDQKKTDKDPYIEDIIKHSKIFIKGGEDDI